jgi:signal peptidase I
MKILSSSITVLLFFIFIFMIFVVISSKASGGEPSFLGYQLKTVLSGSMEPTFKTGSIIAIKPIDDPATLKKSDVISFMRLDHSIVTHRIVGVVKQGSQLLFKTKGDNNKDSDFDPVLSQNVIGKYTNFTIPYLGYIVDYAKSNKGMALLLIIPGVLLLIYSVLTIYQALKEIDKTKNVNEKVV